MTAPIRQFKLSDKCTVQVFDHTSRYYGDFHHVKMEIICEFPVLMDYFPDEKSHSEACRVLGNRVTYRRTIEQMGTPSPELDNVRQQLIESFVANSLPYISCAEFPSRFISSELVRKKKKR